MNVGGDFRDDNCLDILGALICHQCMQGRVSEVSLACIWVDLGI